jgi:hypothetical protein
MAINHKAEDEAIVEARAEYHARPWPKYIQRLPDELAQKRPACVSCQAVGRQTNQSAYASRGSERKPLGIISSNQVRKRKEPYNDAEKIEHRVRPIRTKFGCTNCSKALCRKREGCWVEHLCTL